MVYSGCVRQGAERHFPTTKGFKTMITRLLLTIPCSRSDIEEVLHRPRKTRFSGRLQSLAMHVRASGESTSK